MRASVASFTVFVLVAICGTQAARPDSILEQRYTSAKLEGLWQGTLASAKPEAARFAILAPTAASPAPVSEVPGGDFGLPFTGTVVGESAGSGGTSSAHSFPVIPLSADDASVLNRRLAWSEIYLARYRYFTAISTDGSAVLQALEERQNAALVEDYLIHARLYFSGEDLQQKCRSITRMGELAKGFTSPHFEQWNVPADWKPLLPIASATTARMGTDALAKLACSVQPVRGRQETKKIVETRVRDKVMVEVRAKVADTLTLLNASSTKFQTLVNEMNVPISSAEIFELERVLGNASANMILVKEDQLKAKDTIASLEAVDLTSLKQPAALQEFEDGMAKSKSVAALIDQTLGAMADLATISGDPAVAPQMAPCAKLRGIYAALDLSQSSDVAATTINQTYEDCIAGAAAVVTKFQKPSLLRTQMAELARRVRQISTIYLTMGAP